MRRKYTLTEAELAEWSALPTEGGEQDRALDAWCFWNRVCRARGIDSASLLAGRTPDQFSAMELGHGKHWCHPMALACRRPPADFELRTVEIQSLASAPPERL